MDGGVGLAIASDQVKIQLCQYHFISIIRRKLTLRPKLQASRELLSLVKSITYLSKEKFIELFTEWQKQWRDFLKEKTVNEETKRWQYTHKSLRPASLSVQKFLSILFTYQDYPELEIPNTNNAVEGFFTALKTALRNHNGLSQENKERFVEGFFRHRDIARLTNKAQSSRSGNESFLTYFRSLSHHRTCRSAYGGLIRFQRVSNHVRLVSSSVFLNFRFR